MRAGDKIFVAGHRGMVGAALVRRLRKAGHGNLLLAGRDRLDLTRQDQVERFFAAERPAVVMLAAARVGGILANARRPGDFIRDNLLIQCHVLEAARRHGVERLLFLGSSCIYPRAAAQPLREEDLLGGPLEPTNEAYAVAKIAGLKMCAAYNRQYGTDFRCVMPANLYGPGDRFDPEGAHVLAALLGKFHAARTHGTGPVEVWGSGTPRREFLHCDDLADACVFLMQRPEFPAGVDFLNVGVGKDLTIRELSGLIAEVVGYTGELRFDRARPDGTPRKLLDVSRLEALGWRASIPLREGIEATYRWYVAEGPGRGDGPA